MLKADRDSLQIAERIAAKQHKQVILQMPDCMLPEALDIKLRIEEALRAKGVSDCELILAADKYSSQAPKTSAAWTSRPRSTWTPL